jgi:transposase-like protein
MEKSNKRGKIPQSDWPLIMARYEAGETLASIARTYDCSPPAISYVVSKSRARQPAREGPAASPGGAEAQLIKATAGDPAEAGRRPRPDLPAAQSGVERRAKTVAIETDATTVLQRPGRGHEPRPLREADRLSRNGGVERTPQPPHMPAPDASGNPQPAPAGSGTRAAEPSPRSEGDMRHKLHLSLGNGTSPHNGSSELLFPSAARPVAEDGRTAPAHAARPPYPTPNRPAAAGFSEAAPPPEPIRPGARETGAGTPPRKEGTGAFIDQELRARVDTDIAAFLAAFDAALMADTQENRSALREATDRLLRAGARTRIELERLEARVPLTVHDRDGNPGAWRHR